MQNMKKNEEYFERCFSKLLLNFMIWICVDFVFEILVDDRFGFVRNTTLTNSTNFISQFSPYHWYETNGLSKIPFCDGREIRPRKPYGKHQTNGIIPDKADMAINI